MTVKRSISFNEYCWGVVEKAQELWPEHADNLSALINKIIAEWDRSYSGGGKSQRVISRIAVAESNIIDEIRRARDSGCDCVAGYDDNGMEISRT